MAGGGQADKQAGGRGGGTGGSTEGVEPTPEGAPPFTRSRSRALCHGLPARARARGAPPRPRRCGSERAALHRVLPPGDHGRRSAASWPPGARGRRSAAWFFWLLTRHRDVEREVLREITTATATGSYAAGGQGKMRVLHAALCETMRLYPPVAWDSKHAAAADVLHDGTREERGDRVTYFQYEMGRMEFIWGADAADFSLQRWLSLPAEDSNTAAAALPAAGVSPFKYPVFQAGPRTCLGKEMAFVQMKFVASTVLRRFELVPVDEGRVPAFLPLMTAHMAGGLNVTVRSRGGEPSLAGARAALRRELAGRARASVQRSAAAWPARAGGAPPRPGLAAPWVLLCCCMDALGQDEAGEEDGRTG